MAERDPHIQMILEKVDLVQLIEKDELEPLKREGNKLVGYHGHEDSKGKRCLTINLDASPPLWGCFHCGDNKKPVGGTAIDYVIHKLGCDVGDAINWLCEEFRIDRPDWTPEQRKTFRRNHEVKAAVQEVIHAAFEYYHNQMTDEHWNYCRKRGLTDETITENLLGFAPKGGRALVEHLGKKYPDKDLLLQTGLFFLNKDGTLRDRYYDGRLVIPYWYQGKIVFSIGRSVDPEIEAHKKYVKHLVHSEKYPYVSKLAVQHILWGEDSIQPGRPILVVEGIFDAMLAKQHFGEQYTVISPVTTRISNEQCQRTADLAKNKKVPAIIFVNDNEVSKAGEGGACQTALKIHAQWEAELEAEGVDITKPKHERDAEAWRPELKITTLRRPPEQDKVDLADYLSQGKVEKALYWIEAARTLQRFKQYIEGNPIRFFFGKNFTPKYMADELRTESRYYLYTARKLFEYQSGVYLDGEDITQRIVQAKLKDRSRDMHINESVKFLNVAESGVKPEQINPDDGKLNLENCVFNIMTGEMESHTPDFYSTIRVPVHYDPAATCNRIDQFFSEVLPADCLQLIDEMLGYCLIQNVRFQKAFMLTGSGANGKSTLINLLCAFLGNANVSKVPLQELDENKFKRAELFGKLANVFADLDARALKSSTYFKTIVSGDEIDAERKFRDPFFFSPFSKLIFSANEIPKSRDKTFAYYRRWTIIPFPNQFVGKSDNKNLIDELTTPEELSGLFNRALRGLERLLVNGEFSENQSTRDALERYKTENDSVKEFLEEYCIIGPEAEVGSKKLYGLYRNFCEQNKYAPESQTKFNKKILEEYPQVVKSLMMLLAN